MNVQNFKLESFGRGQPKRLLTTTTSWISKFRTFITYWVGYEGYEGYECSKLQSFVLLYYTALKTISKSEFVFEHNDIGGGTVVQWYTGTVLPPQMLCPERESNKPNDYVLQWYSTTPSQKYCVPSVNRRSQKIVSRAWIEHAASRSSVLRSTDWAIGTFRIEFKPSHVVHSQFDDDLYLEGTNSICTNPSEIHSTALDQ